MLASCLSAIVSTATAWPVFGQIEILAAPCIARKQPILPLLPTNLKTTDWRSSHSAAQTIYGGFTPHVDRSALSCAADRVSCLKSKTQERIDMRCNLLALTAAALLMPAASATAEDFHAKFSGFNEVGALNAETGAILSNGQATLKLNLNRQLQSLTYTLTFSNLGAPVTQAHIHFGKVHVPGGVMVFLCTNLNNGPAGTPACPAGGGTVTGTLTPASVVGPAAQNIPAGDFQGVVEALQSDSAYGNIHTTQFPAGEIRGQVRRGEDDDQ